MAVEAESCACANARESRSAQFCATEAFLELEITSNSRGSFDAHAAVTKHDETEMRFEFYTRAISSESLLDCSEMIGRALSSFGVD
jgi:hypothetical protein